MIAINKDGPDFIKMFTNLQDLVYHSRIPHKKIAYKVDTL